MRRRKQIFLFVLFVIAAGCLLIFRELTRADNPLLSDKIELQSSTSELRETSHLTEERTEKHN